MTPLITPRRLAAWCLFVGLLAGLAAALGVFARGDGAFETVTSVRGEAYRMATDGVYANSALQLVAEGVGWDVFTLLVAVPTLVLTVPFVARGSFLATLIATGALGYVLYLHLEYAVTWAFGPMFILFISALAASLIGLVGAGALLARAGLSDRFDRRFPRRAWAGLSLGMSLLLIVMWSGRIAGALATATPALHGESTMTVQALDIGLVVPISVVIAVAAVRRHPVGLAAALAFAVMFVLMSAAIASMMVSSWVVTGVPAMEPIVGFTLASVAALTLLSRMLASANNPGSREPTEQARIAEPHLSTP
jgi:hypothetical protein